MLPNITLIITNNDIDHLHSKYGKHKIYYEHKLQNKESKERRFIHTNERYFDIDKILLQLNENDKKIDLIILSLETNTTCFPKNLYKIKCPKLAYIGDTFHLMYPISTIINYLKQENIEHILVSSQASHLHFFYEIGIKHSALYPRQILKFKTINNKKDGITYIGKKWKSSHPRKCRMLQFLEKELPKNNIPFYHYNRLSHSDWLKTLARSKMIVISSLNGQFTPQIYACLSAGTLCFIDELSSQTLLYQFFETGKHLITWCNFDDLLKKIIYYYNHPKEANNIAKAGQYQVINNFVTTKDMLHVISDFVFKNKINQLFLSINDKRCQNKRIESLEYFNARIRLYENIQELHHIHESLTLISLTKKNLNPSVDLADLPRLNITHVFTSIKSKSKADLYFQKVGVDHQIKTVVINNIWNLSTYDIGILEIQSNWKHVVKYISNLLKTNSLIWVLGKLTLAEKKMLKKEGFKPYTVSNNPITLKTKEISRKICNLFWKIGKFPFPYLTIKPAMKTVPNLNVFIRGWQSKFLFLY